MLYPVVLFAGHLYSLPKRVILPVGSVHALRHPTFCDAQCVICTLSIICAPSPPLHSQAPWDYLSCSWSPPGGPFAIHRRRSYTGKQIPLVTQLMEAFLKGGFRNWNKKTIFSRAVRCDSRCSSADEGLSSLAESVRLCAAWVRSFCLISLYLPRTVEA